MAKVISVGNKHLPRMFCPFIHKTCGSEIQFFHSDVEISTTREKQVLCPVCKEVIKVTELESQDWPEPENAEKNWVNPNRGYTDHGTDWM